MRPRSRPKRNAAPARRRLVCADQSADLRRRAAGARTERRRKSRSGAPPSIAAACKAGQSGRGARASSCSLAAPAARPLLRRPQFLLRRIGRACARRERPPVPPRECAPPGAPPPCTPPRPRRHPRPRARAARSAAAPRQLFLDGGALGDARLLLACELRHPPLLRLQLPLASERPWAFVSISSRESRRLSSCASCACAAIHFPTPACDCRRASSPSSAERAGEQRADHRAVERHTVSSSWPRSTQCTDACRTISFTATE